MNLRTAALILALTASGATAEVPNPILYWNTQANTALASITPGQQSPIYARTLALVHGATWAAAYNARKKNQGAGVEKAAISYAAHDVLATVFPQQSRTFDNALKSFLGNLTTEEHVDQAAVETGRNVGQEAAQRLLIKRIADGANHYVKFNGTWTPTGPAPPAGEYIPTPPGLAYPPAVPQARYITPWVLRRPVPFYRAPSPPALNSDAYVEALNEVKNLGRKTGSPRTKDQTDIAYFWLEPTPTRFNKILSAIIAASPKKFDHYTLAQWYYVFNVALADTGIAVWDTKNTYNTWRPISAIQYDGVYLKNGTNVADPAWSPLITTPDHQDYVSNHSGMGGAATLILQHLFGDRTSFSLSSNVTTDNYGVVTRSYTRLSDAGAENGRSRIYGGIHFTFADAEGQNLGRKVASDVLKEFVKDRTAGLEGVVGVLRKSGSRW
ncbi:hypothetical protein HK104_000268 [Borealophlyctis nickersoniae]|nr:hypothetical protein HK104_000268 [Borealophlyctis nickersoniae]